MTLQAWQAYAEPRTGQANGKGGIVIVENEQDCIVGLFGYTVAEDMLHGPTLAVDTFIALDLIDPEDVTRALTTAMERQARHLECRAVHVSVPESGRESGARIVHLLLRQGHQVEALSLCRRLPAEG